MHHKPTVRHALAAVTAVAALVALPNAAAGQESPATPPPVEEVRAELDGLRRATEDPRLIGVDRSPAIPRERVATEREALRIEVKRLRRVIEERNAGELLSRTPRVVMGPAQLPVTSAGEARLRMACTDDAVKACRGIVWLENSDRAVVAQAPFRIAAGEAEEVALALRTRERRQARRLVAVAAVRDASGAVWTSDRRISLEA